MPLKEKLQEELKAIGITALYFGCWILALLVIKWLVPQNTNNIDRKRPELSFIRKVL